jgi:hypothetical protein
MSHTLKHFKSKKAIAFEERILATHANPVEVGKVISDERKKHTIIDKLLPKKANKYRHRKKILKKVVELEKNRGKRLSGVRNLVVGVGASIIQFKNNLFLRIASRKVVPYKNKTTGRRNGVVKSMHPQLVSFARAKDHDL